MTNGFENIPLLIYPSCMRHCWESLKPSDRHMENKVTFSTMGSLPIEVFN